MELVPSSLILADLSRMTRSWLSKDDSEFTTIHGARESLVARGVAQFSADGNVRLLNPHQDDSWYKRAVVALNEGPGVGTAGL